MTTHTAYEVRVQRNDNWRVEAIFDDEKLAIAAARRVEARSLASPVVVLQEIYDAARNHLKSRSVYRSGHPLSASNAPRPEPRAARRGLVIVLLTAALVAGALVMLSI